MSTPGPSPVQESGLTVAGARRLVFVFSFLNKGKQIPTYFTPPLPRVLMCVEQLTHFFRKKQLLLCASSMLYQQMRTNQHLRAKGDSWPCISQGGGHDSVPAVLAYTLALIFLGRGYWITQFSKLFPSTAQVFLQALKQESAWCQGLAVLLHFPRRFFGGILPLESPSGAALAVQNRQKFSVRPTRLQIRLQGHLDGSGIKAILYC